MLQLPERKTKPRQLGITSIHDVSLNTTQLEAILKDYSNFMDFAKFGVGTAYITPNLKEKIALYKKYNVIPYFGGTLFEKFYAENKMDAYCKFLEQNDIKHIEISTGTIEISLENRISLIKELNSQFTILSEVGSKDLEKVMAPSVWINEIQNLLEAGSKYVITEGRNSGTAGIFRPNGEIREGLLQDIISSCDTSKLIFEAPNPSAQMHFINLLGSNVNLGNISPNDLLLLETQRCGLRSETFNVK